MPNSNPPNSHSLKLFRRKSLDQITRVPDDIISVYVVEQHIWTSQGTEEDRQIARKLRIAESRTVEEFLIEPVRPFLMDFFRQLSAPYVRERKDVPVGQGYWIQAEFGSGKSHLLSFIGALALGAEKEWTIVQEKETKAGKGKRESLHFFYENGLARKTKEGKGILVAVKTLVGQGGGGIGVTGAGKSLTEYVLDAVADHFYLENDRSLPLYPTEILAERFLREDFERYRRDLAKFLSDPSYFDEEKQWDLETFLDNLQNNPDPGVQRDCGQRLWDFYEHYLKIRPKIPLEAEDVLKHMVERLLDEGYTGLLIILDEVSLFMKGRSDAERVEDEKALVVLSNRLAKVENLPIWTVCAAQQAIETKLVGVKNIIADERLKLVPLLNKADYYYDIALSRVREVTDPSAVDQYFEDYKRSFSWPQAFGKDQFIRFFPFFPPAIDVVRAVSYNLTTVRSALYFMLETIKSMRKRKSDELITLWSLFDDVVSYEEDPSGTSRGIASIKTKFPEEWQAYEEAKRQIDSALSGQVKVFRSRCEKIVKTLFLYHIANLSPDGLTHEELMNAVMEWKDHDRDRAADLQDNFDHYETLAGKLDIELVQIEKVGNRYRFNPTGTGVDPHDLFLRARAEAEQNESLRRDAWRRLLALDGWYVETSLLSLDLAHGIQSIFREIAIESQTDITLRWHGREISGRVFMRDLMETSHHNKPLPSINSPETGLDFHVYISSTPATGELDALVKAKDDPRVLFWAPAPLTPGEENLLIDFTAYGLMVSEAGGQETEKTRTILDWIQGRLTAAMGTIYRIVPDSYGRGRIAAADHTTLAFTTQGELASILAPLVSQVLDSIYESRELVFETPAPFNDVNAINVINGIVKLGVYERNAKVTKELSASQNYGFGLGIMRRPNDRRLDLRECRFAQDIADWIEEKLGDSGGGIPAGTILKNFMGIGGPGGRHYGLSKRLVQLYLLCLARDGQVRITLSGRNQPAEAIDYSNIASIDFKAAILDAFDQVQRLKPPQGWEVLAPFTAVLLKDEAVATATDDADIHHALQRLLTFKTQELEPSHKLLTNLDELIQDIDALLPGSGMTVHTLTARLQAWEKFLDSHVQVSNPIPFLRSGLEKAFGYPIYHDDEVRIEDVDDLASRRLETEQVRGFLQFRDELRAAVRYISMPMTSDEVMKEVEQVFEKAGRDLKNRLDAWIRSESTLRSEFLDPVQEAMETYRVRYLQLFDQVVSHTEQVRQEILNMSQESAYRALTALAHVPQLGEDTRPRLQSLFAAYARQDGEAITGEVRKGENGEGIVQFSQPPLFPQNLTRAAVERALKQGPQPPNCPLTFANAAAYHKAAEAAIRRCAQAVQDALVEKARLLTSPALRERLEAGRHEAFIAGLLACEEPGPASEYLLRTLGQAPEDSVLQAVELLIRYLRKITIRKLRLADFEPDSRTIERGQVDGLVDAFRAFVLAQFEPDGEEEFIVVEIE